MFVNKRALCNKNRGLRWHFCCSYPFATLNDNLCKLTSENLATSVYAAFVNTSGICLKSFWEPVENVILAPRDCNLCDVTLCSLSVVPSRDHIMWRFFSFLICFILCHLLAWMPRFRYRQYRLLIALGDELWIQSKEKNPCVWRPQSSNFIRWLHSNAFCTCQAKSTACCNAAHNEEGLHVIDLGHEIACTFSSLAFSLTTLLAARWQHTQWNFKAPLYKK